MSTALGDVVVRYQGDRLFVERADPKSLISDELLLLFEAGENHPDVSCVDHGGVRVVTIDGINQRVVYRVGEYLADMCAHVIEWPD